MSFDIAGISFGVREIIMGLVGLVVLYMLVQLVLMHRTRPLPATSQAQAPAEPALGAALASAYAIPAEEPPEEPVAWQAPPNDFAQNAFMDGVARELDQLRSEVDSLRTEVSVLRDELQKQLNLARATQAIAPIYGDAMQMAVAGHDASAISERCGIARAEAELVEAMVRNQKARTG